MKFVSIVLSSVFIIFNLHAAPVSGNQCKHYFEQKAQTSIELIQLMARYINREVNIEGNSFLKQVEKSLEGVKVQIENDPRKVVESGGLESIGGELITAFHNSPLGVSFVSRKNNSHNRRLLEETLTQELRNFVEVNPSFSGKISKIGFTKRTHFVKLNPSEAKLNEDFLLTLMNAIENHLYLQLSKNHDQQKVAIESDLDLFRSNFKAQEAAWRFDKSPPYPYIYKSTLLSHHGGTLHFQWRSSELEKEFNSKYLSIENPSDRLAAIINDLDNIRNKYIFPLIRVSKELDRVAESSTLQHESEHYFHSFLPEGRKELAIQLGKLYEIPKYFAFYLGFRMWSEMHAYTTVPLPKPSNYAFFMQYVEFLNAPDQPLQSKSVEVYNLFTQKIDDANLLNTSFERIENIDPRTKDLILQTFTNLWRKYPKKPVSTVPGS